MKHLRKTVGILMILILGCALLWGCKKVQALTCPFTEITWDNTLEDIEAYEGGESSYTYESSYSGTTYTYEKEYNGYQGTIKYMFDDEDRLVCLAWTYIADSMDELDELYEMLVEETEDNYGKCGFETDNGTSQGNVWYLDDGSVTLSAMTTDSAKSVQYAFIHPDVAEEKPE